MEIENKIAKSGLITLDLGDYYDETPRVDLDIKPWLFQEMIIREKEFKNYIKEHNWEQYQGKYVCYYCSCDAIIPNWAWMLISAALQNNCKRYYNGTKDNFNEILYSEAIKNINSEEFTDQRVLLKGCGDKDIPASAFSMLSSQLLPKVKSLMFGEACSNVPIYKRKK